jgi:hypothetical protein
MLAPEKNREYFSELGTKVNSTAGDELALKKIT